MVIETVDQQFEPVNTSVGGFNAFFLLLDISFLDTSLARCNSACAMPGEPFHAWSTTLSSSEE